MEPMEGMQATRHLKRNFTIWMDHQGNPNAGSYDSPPGGCASPGGPSGNAYEGSPPAQVTPPPLVPRMPLLGGQVDAENSPMDPPLQPPPWKRASRGAPAATSRHCHGTVGSLCGSDFQQSPQRLLTPRVSWSDIALNSQESIDEEVARRASGDASPRTPTLRTRQPPSPPKQRDAWRRRPPSDASLGSHFEAAGRGEHDQNEGRFEREFKGVTAIGRGQFSTVFRAQHRIDQCHYAVKRTTQISRSLKSAQLREVFALANVSMAVEGCPNIVRYYSSWVEDGRLHIQTELCECSLRDRLAQRRRHHPGDPRFGQEELVRVLRHVASGLRTLHACGFVHLDIKPDNILVSRCPREVGCYKIADLGLAVAALGSGCDDVSEGDCRYLAREVLRGDLSDLPKADVFSLGLVCYELAINPKTLPCNGEEWHRLREGRLDLDLLAPLPEPFVAFMLRLVMPVPAERPQCEDIVRHPCVAPDDGLQALQDQMKKRTEEAERNRRLADEYWHELLSLKRQELLTGAGRAPTSPLPAAAAGTSPKVAASAAVTAAQVLGSPAPLRRGRTS